MRIQQTISSTSFTSRNNPVKPFLISTKLGELSCFEIPSEQLLNNKTLNEFSHFFCQNFASLTNDPYWLSYNNPQYQNNVAKDFVRYLKSKIINDDGNLTMLVAKDKDGKLQGACLSYGFDEVPYVKNTTCYIDSISVNPEYRGFSVGKKLLENTCEINKNTFTDVFLKGEVLAAGFYKKQGYKKLNSNDAGQKFVADFIKSISGDDLNYLLLFTKPLQPKKPRWYSIFKT